VSIAALITWVVTALGGSVLLGTWLSRGGLRARETAASRFPPGLIFGHFLLAAAGLVVWIIYVITDADALTWVALAILPVVAALGVTMVGRWRQRRSPTRAALPGRRGLPPRAAGGRHARPRPAHRPRRRLLTIRPDHADLSSATRSALDRIRVGIA
jgi:hypothetical protein